MGRLADTLKETGGKILGAGLLVGIPLVFNTYIKPTISNISKPKSEEIVMIDNVKYHKKVFKNRTTYTLLDNPSISVQLIDQGNDGTLDYKKISGFAAPKNCFSLTEKI